MRIIFLSTILLLTACGQVDKQATARVEDSARPVVYTVNYPLAWAAQQLAGAAVEINFPVPAGTDPAAWEPELESLSGFQQADLILLNGAGYATWLQRISLPLNRLVDTSSNFGDELIAVDGGPLHSHGPTGEHSHGELAFTLWLDLELFAQQVAATAVALQRVLPEQATAIGERARVLDVQLSTFNAELLAIGTQLAAAPILYSHPVYQYLQRRYQLNGIALHWEPDQVPGEKEWAQLDALLTHHPARLMLWEDQPLAETRAGLAQRGVQVVVFRPLGKRPERGDFGSAMAANIDRFHDAASRPGLP